VGAATDRAWRWRTPPRMARALLYGLYGLLRRPGTGSSILIAASTAGMRSLRINTIESGLQSQRTNTIESGLQSQRINTTESGLQSQRINTTESGLQSRFISQRPYRSKIVSGSHDHRNTHSQSEYWILICEHHFSFNTKHRRARSQKQTSSFCPHGSSACHKTTK
jgi:hypothetical protein